MSAEISYFNPYSESKSSIVGVTGWRGRLGSTLLDLDENLVEIYGDITSLDFKVPNYVNTIINCAAKTDVCEAESSPDEYFRVNTKGAFLLANYCRNEKKRLIHISTDHVFGPNACKSTSAYKEDCTPTPEGVYAMTKYLGEEAILKAFGWYSSPAPLIIRTSFMKEFTMPKAFVDKYWSGDTIDTIAIEILKAVQIQGIHGILHIGTGKKSIYDVARKLNPSVQPMYLYGNPINKVGLSYIKDTTLDTTKWEEIKAKSIWI
jgi:dTDP-4-dehydrorhamnose reductase